MITLPTDGAATEGARGRSLAFHVMTKPRGAVCNLACAYCFYLTKEQLYHDGSFRMSDAMLEDYIRQYLAAQRGPEITFAWQGGEPTLMGLEFFRRVVKLQGRFRPADVQVRNSLQTNATLLDDAWCQFLSENGFLVGVSLDGPSTVHDRYRRDRGGGPTFDRVMAGVRALQRHGVEYNILACIHEGSPPRALEIYRFFRDEVGAQFIQFIPIVERIYGGPPGEPPVSPRSVSAAGFGQFLITVFDEWVRHDVGRLFVQGFDVALAAWMGLPPGLCIFEETCGLALALEHNGDLYACDHFVHPDYRLGNIAETPLIELVRSERQREFGLAKWNTLPATCRACEFLFACNGECPRNRFTAAPDGEPGMNYLCAGYLAFFRHIDPAMRSMASLLHSGRAPAEIMAQMAAADASVASGQVRVGRNDPCPCGSGRKYKQCHGRK